MAQVGRTQSDIIITWQQADWFFILYQQPMSLLLNIQILAVAVLQKASIFPSSSVLDLIRVIMCAI